MSSFYFEPLCSLYSCLFLLRSVNFQNATDFVYIQYNNIPYRARITCSEKGGGEGGEITKCPGKMYTMPPRHRIIKHNKSCAKFKFHVML